MLTPSGMAGGGAFSVYRQTSFIRTAWCPDCETCGLLNHCKYNTMEEVTQVRIVLRSDCEAYGLKKHGLTRSDCTCILA